MDGDSLILEGIVTTLNSDRSPNISPMGPRVDAEMRNFVLRPFQTSRTHENLRRTGEGVFHVTDDVELLGRAAIGQLDPLPPLAPARALDGVILKEACRWYAFRVVRSEDDQPRASIVCEVVETGRIRDFLGFNRAKHAVLEVAILATRVDILPATEIADQLDRLAVIVGKTAGQQENRAFQLLADFIQNRLGRRK